MKKLFPIFLFLTTFSACKTKHNDKAAAPQSSTETEAAIFSPKPKVNVKTIGILLYDGYTTLDAMAPLQVLNGLKGTQVFFVGRHKGLIEDENGVKTQVDTAIDDVKQLDVLLVPGGFRETYQATKDMALLAWVKRIDTGSKYTCSVCTGAWILGAAGLLQNKQATTYWYGKKILADEFGVTAQNKRYVQDGKYWTSAGVSAGLDMSLALLNDIVGETYTRATMLQLEYDPQPPFKGGGEGNTDAALVAAVRKRYDGVMEPVLHPEAAFRSLQLDNRYDPGCGMPLKAGVGDTAHYKGKLYGFCSAECKTDFLKNPAMAVK